MKISSNSWQPMCGKVNLMKGSSLAQCGMNGLVVVAEDTPVSEKVKDILYSLSKDRQTKAPAAPQNILNMPSLNNGAWRWALANAPSPVQSVQFLNESANPFLPQQSLRLHRLRSPHRNQPLLHPPKTPTSSGCNTPNDYSRGYADLSAFGLVAPLAWLAWRRRLMR